MLTSCSNIKGKAVKGEQVSTNISYKIYVSKMSRCLYPSQFVLSCKTVCPNWLDTIQIAAVMMPLASLASQNIRNKDQLLHIITSARDFNIIRNFFLNF